MNEMFPLSKRCIFDNIRSSSLREVIQIFLNNFEAIEAPVLKKNGLFVFWAWPQAIQPTEPFGRSLQCSLSRVIFKRFLLYALCAVRDGGYGLQSN
jgi:hypothetical protein